MKSIRCMPQALAMLGVAGLVAVTATGVAFAGSSNHVTLGTPGTPSCVGQSTAELAQTATFLGSPGIAGMASLSGLTVPQVKEAVSVYCDPASFLGSSVSRLGSIVSPREPSGGGGTPPSCDDAQAQAGALNAIANVEGIASGASFSAGDTLGGLQHQANQQALQATAQAIVAASCPPALQ